MFIFRFEDARDTVFLDFVDDNLVEKKIL